MHRTDRCNYVGRPYFAPGPRIFRHAVNVRQNCYRIVNCPQKIVIGSVHRIPSADRHLRKIKRVPNQHRSPFGVADTHQLYAFAFLLRALRNSYLLLPYLSHDRVRRLLQQRGQDIFSVGVSFALEGILQDRL